jgi:hypothetical protein
MQGLVNGGRSRAVVGARVYVLQANAGGAGNRSTSLLTAATGNPADAIGYYALTGEFGGFSIAGTYACTAGRPVYLYVRGGNSGDDGPNSAIGLMASLGACPQNGSFDKAAPFVVVNEVTTVAAAYAMAGAATDPLHLPASEAGIGGAANLASVATGFANDTLPDKPANKIPRTKIHTLANILSACVNSSSPSSVGCTTLFDNARSRGRSGKIPTDTAAAAINIARNPHANVAALFGLQPRMAAPFLPALDVVPPDFTISVGTSGASLTASLSPGS